MCIIVEFKIQPNIYRGIQNTIVELLLCNIYRGIQNTTYYV